MAKLGFSYLPHLRINPKTGKKEEVFTPFVPIKVSINNGEPTHLIDAIVDSGADRNLFPMSLATLLKIRFGKVKPEIIHGIGNIKIKAYSAKINIWVNNTKYESQAAFCKEQQILLLGRNGFFSLFKTVTFDEKGRFLYIQTN